MLFDLAVELTNMRRLRLGVNALENFDVVNLKRLLSENFNPDTEIASSRFSWLKGHRAPRTTLLLALAQAPLRPEVDDSVRQEMLNVLLDAGADPHYQVEGDTRSAVLHLANRRDLQAWKSIALRQCIGGREPMKSHVQGIGWSEALEWLNDNPGVTIPVTSKKTVEKRFRW